MKKVLNWTVGSFFRTIGRTIAFLVMGGLIYYLLSYNGIGIKDLFFDRVNAETYDNMLYVNYYQDSNRQTQFDQNGAWWVYFTDGSVTSYNSSFKFKTLYFNEGNNVSSAKGGRLYIPFYFDLPLVNSRNTSTIYGSDTCSRWQCTQWDSNNECLRFTCDYTTGSQDSTVSDFEYIEPQTKITAILYFNNDINVSCNVDYANNRFDCPIPKNDNLQTLDFLVIDHKVFFSSTSHNYNLGVGRRILYYDSDGANITNSINNQTQQQQQQHEEMMDSNTTEAEEEATSFFDDFEAPDIGGLSSIVTAPLNTIRSLLNSTCTNLQLPLPYVNKTLTLPCMNSIYTEHFGAFFSIYQTIILAIIAYRCIRSIFFDIHGFTNPSDDRIEVMDL